MSVKTFLIRSATSNSLSRLVNMEDIDNLNLILHSTILPLLKCNPETLTRFTYGRKRSEAIKTLDFVLDIVPSYCVGFVNMLLCDENGNTDFITVYFKHVDGEYIYSGNGIMSDSNWIVAPNYPDVSPI